MNEWNGLICCDDKNVHPDKKNEYSGPKETSMKIFLWAPMSNIKHCYF